MSLVLEQTTTIMGAFSKSVTRQRAMLFSSLILPLITLFSTWWVTVDDPMPFKLENGKASIQSMLDIHVLTGGLTAVAITAGIFGFLLTVDNKKTTDRLIIMGYSEIAITVGWLLSLLTILSMAAIITYILTIILYTPNNLLGVFVAILLTTLIYATVGYVVGSIYPKLMEGTLIVLVFSFIDLMLLSNPMGTEIYLSPWTYYMPGFWPTQLALEAGFFDGKISYLKPILWSFIETISLLSIVIIYRSSLAQKIITKIRGSV